MKNIIFYHQKGGVGKTTLAYNFIKYALEFKDYQRVYFEDLDTQESLKEEIEDSPYPSLKNAISYSNQELSSSDLLISDYPGATSSEILKKLAQENIFSKKIVIVPVVFKKKELSVISKIAEYFTSNWYILQNKVQKENILTAKQLLQKELGLKVINSVVKTSLLLEQPEKELSTLGYKLRLGKLKKVLEEPFEEIFSILNYAL